MTPTAELRQQLRAAEAAEARQKAAQAKVQIARLTADGAKLRIELEPLAAKIRAARQKRLTLHGELLQARNQIRAYEKPLDPLTFPSAEDERERQRQLAAWTARQGELLAAAKANEESIAFSVMRHAIGLEKRLTEIKFEIENLTSIAEGRRPGEVTGGVYMGVEDFIGNTQMPPRHST